MTDAELIRIRRKKYRDRYTIRNSTIRSYHLMLLPGVVLLAIFSYTPMVGIIMAFQKYIPAKGIFNSDWMGLQNFEYIFSLPNTWLLFKNTIILACSSIALDIVVPILFALLLNEVRHVKTKKTIQTAIYLPNFLSWVMLAEIFRQMFALAGPVNNFITSMGLEPVYFLGSNQTFKPFLILSNSWKSFGYSSIIYTASILNIDPSLYEAAHIDGATRLQRIVHITLPGMASVIVLKATLALGSVLSANFDQVFNLYSAIVYESGDIIDTYVYRMGILQAQFSISTAVGLLKSVISSFLIVISYGLAKKFAGYRIF